MLRLAVPFWQDQQTLRPPQTSLKVLEGGKSTVATACLLLYSYIINYKMSLFFGSCFFL